MLENLKKRFWRRYIQGSIELEKRRQRKQERDKKKMMSLKQGSISYGFRMKQSPVQLMKDVYEIRKLKRKNKI